ncbi:LigA [Gemmatirosa kalamazoonensis]|uniref:LigA n=1 Tax=Gemmatirosa kalamazoonensis TaxID=861299 RepID=W0RBV9_9BACT|nr:LigA [Gemmatirosa kalamazoonensis]
MRRRAAARARRSAAAAAGAHESRRQRVEVHRRWLGARALRDARRRHGGDPGRRHRHRHRLRGAAARVRRVLSGALRADAPSRWEWARARDLAPPRGAHGRLARRDERGRARLHVHRAAARGGGGERAAPRGRRPSRGAARRAARAPAAGAERLRGGIWRGPRRAGRAVAAREPRRDAAMDHRPGWRRRPGDRGGRGARRARRRQRGRRGVACGARAAGCRRSRVDRGAAAAVALGSDPRRDVARAGPRLRVARAEAVHRRAAHARGVVGRASGRRVAGERWPIVRRARGGRRSRLAARRGALPGGRAAHRARGARRRVRARRHARAQAGRRGARPHDAGARRLRRARRHARRPAARRCPGGGAHREEPDGSGAPVPVAHRRACAAEG